MWWTVKELVELARTCADEKVEGVEGPVYVVRTTNAF